MTDTLSDIELLDLLHALVNSDMRSEEIEVSELNEEEEIESKPEQKPDISFLTSNSMGDKHLPSLCRLCATPGDDLIDMFSRNQVRKLTVEKIKFCLPAVEVKRTDTLTKEACRICLIQLELCYQFLKTAAEAGEKLRTFYEQQSDGRGQGNEPTETPQPYYGQYTNTTLANDEEKPDITTTYFADKLPMTDALLQSDIISSNLNDNVDEDGGTNSLNDNHENIVPFMNTLNSSRSASQADQGTSCSPPNHSVHSDEELGSDRDASDSELYSPPVTRSGKALNNPRNESMKTNNNDDLSSRKKGGEEKDRKKLFTEGRRMEKKSVLDDRNKCEKKSVSKSKLVDHKLRSYESLGEPCERQDSDVIIDTERTSQKRKESGRGRIASTEKNQFTCAHCGRTFKTKTHIIIHMRTHAVERTYGCDLCSKTFPILRNMKRHRIIHTGNGSHSCGFCSKTFAFVSYRNRHRTIHTGERPHSCDFCSKRFTTMKTRNRHQLIHTGERPYNCRFCTKTFARSDNRNQHEMIHTGEQRYDCDVCSKKFNRVEHRNRHRFLIHTRKKTTS